LTFFLVWRHMTFKRRVFNLQQTNFASYEESTSSPIQGLLLFLLIFAALVFVVKFLCFSFCFIFLFWH